MSWTAKKIRHQGQERIAITFPLNPDTESRIRKLPGAAWSDSLKVWHVPYTPENCLRFKITEKEKPKLSEASEQKLMQFRSWMASKRMSPSTIKTYGEAMTAFMRFFEGKKAMDEITNDDIIYFNNEFVLKKGLSASYQNQVVNGLKKYFQFIEHKKIELDSIQRPKKYNPLPKVLSIEEVTKILDALDNLKHKCMLSLIYSAGLRRSELINMKISDIDSSLMQITIRQAKGGKDRIVPLSNTILDMLRDYFKVYQPKEFLFEGQGKEQYSERSLAMVLKRACKLAGIKKEVNLHMLRHSYATHLLESGTDLRYIQELLGHKSSRTTEIYTHVSNQAINKIVSPLDKLNLKIKSNPKK